MLHAIGAAQALGRVSLTISTANTRLLRWDGAYADVVGLTGSGRTLSDGHLHEFRWRASQIEAQVAHVARRIRTRPADARPVPAEHIGRSSYVDRSDEEYPRMPDARAQRSRRA
jgi:hypothetical protein